MVEQARASKRWLTLVTLEIHTGHGDSELLYVCNKGTRTTLALPNVVKGCEGERRFHATIALLFGPSFHGTDIFGYSDTGYSESPLTMTVLANPMLPKKVSLLADICLQ